MNDKLLKKNLLNLLKFDKLRIFKILELLQYSIIFGIVAIFLSKLIHVIFPYEVEELKKKNKIVIHLECLIISFLYALLTFYIVKIARIIPSIVNLFDNEFKPYTTLHYTVDVIFVVIFVKYNKSLTSRLKFLNYI